MSHWFTRHKRTNGQAAGAAPSVATESLAVRRLKEMLRQREVRTGPDGTHGVRRDACDAHRRAITWFTLTAKKGVLEC